MAGDEDQGWQQETSRKSRREQRRDDNDYDDDEPDFNDPPSYVDDIDDEELLGDLLKRRPKETDGIESVIVVDNVPCVGAERLDKLQNVIRKIFNKFGKIQTEHFPKESDGKTKGYIFLEYQSPEEALEAVKNTNGYKLDRQHTFIVNMFSDFEKYAAVTEEWEQPEIQPYKDHGNLLHWLLDPHDYDQFSVIYEGGDRTAIITNSVPEPTVLEERPRWTETYVRWSPKGTLLATFHQRGIALWGGETFKQISRFSHTGVQLIDFSPCEKYLVSFSPVPDNRDDPQAVIIWDIRSGMKKRGFHCENASVWPIFKWSHDGRYFARMASDSISVYETPSFGLLDKKSIKVQNLQEFMWSPSDNMLAYWRPGEGDRPAAVTLMKIPSRDAVCVKNFFQVADIKMHWQRSGDHLCVKVDRFKTKKEEKDGVKYLGITHNFSIFRIREKEIPVDTVDVKAENIMAFAWEPVGTKFAFIHGEAPRICVSFYNIKKAGHVEHLNTLEKRQANHLFWSPNGRFIVLAGLRTMSGVLEFVDTLDMTVMATTEHFMASDVEWDPTGRYVATAVSYWAYKVDNAYWLWNFQGKILHKQQMEKFCQILWRPRPPSLLTPEHITEIKKNMKKYNARFAVEDKMRESKVSKEQIEARKLMNEEWNTWRAQCAAHYASEKEERLALRRGIDTDDIEGHVENFEEETIEFLVKVEETILDE
ncbi:hypothetical protein CAPTEDRAFT_163351 [Capitella teleta]|uniref:Eukaryotic translation initiation factor 3 subunit B n=1 Tax=Capitella teleta TaxID=283909 RepID=R7U0B5_CAPTE|nr:hypothetical protein CAPTEDRAFT_163351 [Capitella teleta]|eukprot:ELT99648.1 hypothetical protein CAPTEDRAFT_163351 [Capitella teleta]